MLQPARQQPPFSNNGAARSGGLRRKGRSLEALPPLRCARAVGVMARVGAGPVVMETGMGVGSDCTSRPGLVS